MFPDGICRVTDSYYTKTVQFQDINYQLNQNEDKTAIFDGWCDFLNYFVANFLAAQCGGIHFKLARHMPLLCQVPEHHCRHRAAANIAVTHK